jgi:hypothetical protein
MKKKIYFFLILAALFTGGISSFAQDITTGLKLHYTFDDINAGVVPDHSGNGLAGTIMGAAAPTTGKVGQGLNLIDANDYVQMPNDINANMTDFTFAVWVNFNAASGWGRIFDIGNGQDVNSFLCQTGGAYKFVVKQDATLGEQAVAGPAIVWGTWAHVAVTCSYNAEGVGTATMYINGAPVGTNNNFTNTLAGMGTTLQNYLGKSQYPDPTPNAVIDDFRMYNRALSVDDIMALNGVPTQLVSALKALKLPGDLTQVTENITLPTTIGNDGVTITWATNDSTVITNTGVVTRNQNFPKSATLTATLTYNGSSVTKTFDIIVLPIQSMAETVAVWDFANEKIGKDKDGNTTVIDESDNAYVATCKSGAQIVTIGKAEKVNVLSVKNSGEYFDFGTSIGEAIYGLEDYTVSVFFRKDTTDGTKKWSGYGQQFYGFSNSINMANEAWGAMYYEPLRDRHVCTKDNSGSESSSYVGRPDDKTPNVLLGTWHNITYAQKDGVGVLYHDGVEVSRRDGGMPEPVTALKRAGKSGTLYNSIGRPFYANDPSVTNTLFWGFKLYSVNLSVDDLESVIGIQANIAKLDEANNTMTCNVYDLMSMGDLLKSAKAYLPFAYPGLADLEAAIAAAQKTYDEATVTAADIQALKDAIAAYLKTQPASAAAPMDYTFAITNASFNAGTGGKLDANSNRDSNPNGNGSYNYPEGWTVYLDHSGWCNAAFISDAPAEGAKCYETWAATIRTFDVYQEIDLKAGYYIQSAQIRTNAPAPYTQHIYAMMLPDTAVYNSPVLDSTKVITGTGWNSANNWQTLYNSFYCKGGKVRVGFKSNGFMQFDNMRLAYYGSEKPAKQNFTTSLANPGFEEGVADGVDATSVKGKGGAFKHPIGWNAHVVLDTLAGWCNSAEISGASMSEGSKGFETWASPGMIKEFNISQSIKAPATGFYKLSADLRCDASSPSADTTKNQFDGHVYAKAANMPMKNSSALGEDPTLNTGAGWNNKDAWKKVSVVFEAGIGETINLGIASSSFMQMDNVTLTYYSVQNPAAPARVAYITKVKAMDVTADTIADVIYRSLKADPNLNVTLCPLTDVSTAATFDQSNYDVLIIQESFGGGDQILMPAGALGLAKLTVPTLYNKSYALKKGRALNAGSGSGFESTTAGVLTLTVDAANQSNPLFKGITFTDNAFPVFFASATDLGVAGTKALNYAKSVTGVDGTLLAYPTGDAANATISINDIPAGKSIEDQLLQTRVITFGMNYGAITMGKGANVTPSGIKLWGNAVYVLAGKDVAAGGFTAIEKAPVSNTASVSVYPNPTTAFINVKGADANSVIRIYNLMGQQVFSGLVEGDVVSVDLSKYNTGLYMLQTKSNGKTMTTKFIKK